MKKAVNYLFACQAGFYFSVLITTFIAFALSAEAQSKQIEGRSDELIIDQNSVTNQNYQRQWDYKFTERVQVKIIGGVPRPQFALIYRNPPTTSVADTLSFTADVNGVNRFGQTVSGTMHGSCVATGVEQRLVPTCSQLNPDGTCAILDPLSPLFMCQQVLRLNDPQRGVNGISQLTIQGFIRQLEAAGDPPTSGQRSSQFLAITGGTGRFEGASGMIKYDLRDNPFPPPIKDLEIFVSRW